MSILATHVVSSALGYVLHPIHLPPYPTWYRTVSSVYSSLLSVSSDINPIGSLLLRGPRPLSLRACLPTDTGSTPVLLAPMMLLVAFAVLLPPLTPLPFSPQPTP